MAASTTESNLQQRALELASNRDLTRLEELWLELVQNPPLDPQFYSDLFKTLAQAKAKTKAYDLFVMALDQFKERAEWKMMERLILLLASQFPASEELREYGEAALRGRYSRNSNFEMMLELSKIKSDQPLDQSLKRFRELLRMSPGQVYQHASWGEGVVRSLDLLTGKVVLEFPNEAQKTMTLEGVRKFLTYLPPSHFLAQKAKDPEKLRLMADENASGLARLAVQSAGGRMKQSALKSLLLNSIVPEKAWSSWWTRTRRELQLDPLIDIDSSGGAHAEIVIRAKPKTIEEEVQEIFFASDAAIGQRSAAVQLLAKAQGKTEDRSTFIRKMLERLDADYRTAANLSPAQVLEWTLLVDDLIRLDSKASRAGLSIPDPKTALSKIADYESLNEIEETAHAIRALELLFERDGDEGVRRAAGVFPRAGVRLAQAIWKELNAEHHRDTATGAVTELMRAPLENPSTYVWAVKMLLEDKDYEDDFPAEALVLELLEQLKDWQKVAENTRSDKTEVAAAKSLMEKSRAILSAKNYAVICRVIESITLDQAQRLRRIIQSHPALNPQFKSGVERQVLLTRRELDEAATLKSSREVEVLFCTPRAKEERTRELQELRAVKIPENSKAIEEARKEGDLRENAGYHAAKDEQKMLMQQMLALQEALSTARVVHSSEVNTESIAFGTAIEVANLDITQNESYTILGRWEANPERHILNLQAPMAQQFLGKKIGDEFVMERPDGSTTRYRILSIANGLESGEWSGESQS